MLNNIKFFQGLAKLHLHSFLIFSINLYGNTIPSDTVFNFFFREKKFGLKKNYSFLFLIKS